jgi:hypothetical protein
MPLETATYINQLDAANPLGSDPIASGDDHLRLIKAAVKATFPNITGPVTMTQAQVNGIPSLAPLASPAFTGTPTAPTAAAGTNTTQLATTAYVQGERTALLDAVYPIGSIYTNAVNATNPATLLGFGTWAAFGAGRVMVGHDASDPLFDTAEETGGSKDAIVVAHTHTFSGTTANAGTHSHTGALTQSTKSGNGPTPVVSSAESLTGNYNYTTATAGDHNHTFSGTTASTGSSGTNANLQPYITVYMWKRTA